VEVTTLRDARLEMFASKRPARPVESRSAKEGIIVHDQAFSAGQPAEAGG
jgi:hypothetical protein